MSDRMIGYGSSIELGDGESPEEFTAIPGLKDFEFPRVGEVAEVDVTSHDSPDESEESIPGLKKASEFDIEIHYDPEDAIHLELESIAEGRETRNFRAVDPVDTTYEFEAYLKNFKIGMPVAGAFVASMTLKMAGAPTKL